MGTHPSRSRMQRRWPIAVGACLALCVSFGARPVQAYTPESPEVIEMIQSSLKFLQAATDKGPLGGHCLIALTLVKNNYNLSHPLIQRGIRVCRDNRRQMKDLTNYDIGLAVIFLCETAPRQQADMINAYLGELMRRQLPNGAWSYSYEKGGDTSQTQYAVLAMWTAKNTGFQVSDQAVLKVSNWLMSTQDARTGGWVYHPYNSNESREPTVSLCAAGLGSLYICADMLGIKSKPAPPKAEKGLPPVLVRVAEPKADAGEGARVEVAGVNKQKLGVTVRDGNAYMNRNYTKDINPDASIKFPFYALYAVERYRSFREKTEKRSDNAWYDHGVEFLKKKQGKDGGFNDIFGASGANGKHYQTSFAILFLMRSTKKAIGALSEGQLKGGVGLPSNASKMRLHGGRIVSAEVSRSLSELMDLLDDEETGELSDLAQFSADSLATMPSNPAEYAAHMQRLRGLVTHKKYEIRLVAVRTLAQARDLDNVPALIYALSDPNAHVIKAARDGLRFVSRKVNGFGMPAVVDPARQQEAIDAWKQWYLGIRPDAEFIEIEAK